MVWWQCRKHGLTHLVGMPQEVHVKGGHDEIAGVLLVQEHELAVVALGCPQESQISVVWQAYLRRQPFTYRA